MRLFAALQYFSIFSSSLTGLPCSSRILPRSPCRGKGSHSPARARRVSTPSPVSKSFCRRRRSRWFQRPPSPPLHCAALICAALLACLTSLLRDLTCNLQLCPRRRLQLPVLGPDPHVCRLACASIALPPDGVHDTRYTGDEWLQQINRLSLCVCPVSILGRGVTSALLFSALALAFCPREILGRSITPPQHPKRTRQILPGCASALNSLASMPPAPQLY